MKAFNSYLIDRIGSHWDKDKLHQPELGSPYSPELSIAMFQTPASPGVPNLYKIGSVSREDQGMYTCVARNVVGRAYVAAYLEVANSPRVDLQ